MGRGGGAGRVISEKISRSSDAFINAMYVLFIIRVLLHANPVLSWSSCVRSEIRDLNLRPEERNRKSRSLPPDHASINTIFFIFSGSIILLFCSREQLMMMMMLKTLHNLC